jgi:hypothetical protein
VKTTMKTIMKSILYDDALLLLQRPDHRLVVTFTAAQPGWRFTLAGPQGGPVTDHVAKRLLDHPFCRPADAGLFTETPQSYTLRLDR